MISERFTLIKVEIKKIAKGACYALAGAFFTYLAQYLGNVDFGVYQPLAVAAASWFTLIAHKFIARTTYKENQ